MYKRLQAEMILQGYSRKRLGAEAGMTRATLGRKLRGEAEFTLGECRAIKRALKATASIDELFMQ